MYDYEPLYQTYPINYNDVYLDMKSYFNLDNNIQLKSMLQQAFLEITPPIINNEFGSFLGYITFIRSDLIKISTSWKILVHFF